MPNLPSAWKRMRTAAKAHDKNKAVRSTISTLRRKLFEAVAAKDKEQANAAVRKYSSALDKAAKKGVIKKEKAVRRKRRAMASLAKLA